MHLGSTENTLYTTIQYFVVYSFGSVLGVCKFKCCYVELVCHEHKISDINKLSFILWMLFVTTELLKCKTNY